MKETLGSAKYWLKNFCGQTSIIKIVFYDNTYLWLTKTPLSSPGKINPNQVYED